MKPDDMPTWRPPPIQDRQPKTRARTRFPFAREEVVLLCANDARHDGSPRPVCNAVHMCEGDRTRDALNPLIATRFADPPSDLTKGYR